MKKLVSMISHMAVIGLALLALLIATVVWLFERLGDSGPAASASTDAAVWMEADLGTATLETSVRRPEGGTAAQRTASRESAS